MPVDERGGRCERAEILGIQRPLGGRGCHERAEDAAEHIARAGHGQPRRRRVDRTDRARGGGDDRARRPVVAGRAPRYVGSKRRRYSLLVKNWATSRSMLLPASVRFTQ